MENGFRLTNDFHTPSGNLQVLTLEELSTVIGGAPPAAPPTLTPQQTTNAQAIAIASAIGGTVGGNPLGAPSLGYGAATTYVFQTLYPGLAALSKLLNK
jgi:hypothetical protein